MGKNGGKKGQKIWAMPERKHFFQGGFPNIIFRNVFFLSRPNADSAQMI